VHHQDNVLTKYRAKLITNAIFYYYFSQFLA